MSASASRKASWWPSSPLMLLGLASLAIVGLVAILMKRQVPGGVVCARGRSGPIG